MDATRDTTDTTEEAQFSVNSWTIQGEHAHSRGSTSLILCLAPSGGFVGEFVRIVVVKSLVKSEVSTPGHEQKVCDFNLSSYFRQIHLTWAGHPI